MAEKIKKSIKDRLDRKCVICGRQIRVTLYTDNTYRGGHYFSFEDKKPKNPTLEYWECATCYRAPDKANIF